MSMTNPRGIARCDYSGLMVQHALLKDQMAYRGQGLVKTGYKVHPKFYDQPNPQDLTPLIKPDPTPLINPRPDSQIDVIQPSFLILDVSGDMDVTLTVDQFENNNFLFNGILTGNVVISLPATFNEFFVLNATTGLFTLSVQIINNYASRIELINQQKMLISNDSVNLKIINPN